ncbi:hypothetical protein ACVIEM_005720 [Rhizobium leguminosarum]
MSKPHEDDSEVLQDEEAILLNAVLMWFRFYGSPSMSGLPTFCASGRCCSTQRGEDSVT